MKTKRIVTGQPQFADERKPRRGARDRPGTVPYVQEQHELEPAQLPAETKRGAGRRASSSKTDATVVAQSRKPSSASGVKYM